MVTVVINDENATHFTLRLETASRTGEARQSFSNLVKRHFKLETDCDRRKCIVNVVHARHAQVHLANDVRTAPHTEARSKIVVVPDSMCGDVSLRTQPVR